MYLFQFGNDAENEPQMKRELFRDASRGNWEEVIKTYKDNPSAHTEQITSSRDTALHVAVSNGEESAVERLLDVVGQTAHTRRAALEMKNDLGNTPLHLAAYLGNAKMCRWIAECDSTLMGIRNDDNETPFFVAVRHGRKEAFHALHAQCKDEEGYDYCRGKDGETILHSAISGEYFDLAFDIMNHYKKLVNAVNEQGFLPLHILASKPSAFRSGSHIRGLDKLMYHCIFVDELQPHTLHHNHAEDLEYKEGAAIYPRNYDACVGMFTLLRRIFLALLGYSSQKNDEESNGIEKHDEEENIKDHQQKKQHSGFTALCGRTDGDAERLQAKKAKEARGSSKRVAQGHQFFPVYFIKLISKAMLVVLGLGSLERIRELKAKHIWSEQIMERILDYYAIYIYEFDGARPVKSNARERELFWDLDMEKNETPILMNETPILTAARNGVVEMVAGILKRTPVAAFDMNNEQKNVALLAVEYRQVQVYEFLLEMKRATEAILRKTDKDGNTVLHLAASLGRKHRPWPIPALHMQWEIKWYEKMTSESVERGEYTLCRNSLLSELGSPC